MLYDLSRRQRMTLAASLRLQHRLFLHTLGTLLPGEISIEPSGNVLNVFCGPGIWAIDLALINTKLNIVAIDPDPQMLHLARADARSANVAAITFAPYTLSQTLPYHESSFDLIYIQDVPGAVTLPQWTTLLAELMRILRPGGWLYLTTLEPGPTSSVAADTLLSRQRDILLVQQQQKQHEPSFMPAVLYPRLLSEAGYSDVAYTLTPVDLGNQAGSFGHNYTLILLPAHLRAAHFLVAKQQITQNEVDKLFAQIRADAQDTHYCSTGMIIEVIARRKGMQNG